jgi:hypothetical protein
VAGTPTESQVTVAAKGPDVAYGQILGPVCDDSISTVVINNNFEFKFIGIVTNADGSITIRYNVDELDSAIALLSWRLNLGQCVSAVRSNRNFNIIRAGDDDDIDGIEWDLDDAFDEDEFSITISGPVVLGFNQVIVPGIGAQTLFAPICPIVVGPPGGGGGGDDDDDDEPAEISIETPDIEIEVINDITFVVLVLNVINAEGAGNADEALLRIELEDFLELDNLSFLNGIGFVKSIEDDEVIIGVGMGNTVGKGNNVRMRLRFRVDTSQVSVNAFPLNLVLSYNDTETREQLIPIQVVLTGTTVDGELEGIVVQRLPLQRIDVRFRGRWNQGGLRLYGLPLTDAIELDNGIIVQYFERARFEYHPENAGTEYEILLGLLGVELGYTEPPVAPPEDEAELVWYFEPTGHLIASPFRNFWVNRGGLLTFGYPISGIIETDDGLLVQYFERVRLEYHPSNAGTEYEILLGFLGEESLVTALTEDDMDEDDGLEDEVAEEIGDDEGDEDDDDN